MCTRFTVSRSRCCAPAQLRQLRIDDPLPGRFVGHYTVTTGGKNKLNVVPVELTGHQARKEKRSPELWQITAVLTATASPTETPFNGTYQRWPAEASSRCHW